MAISPVQIKLLESYRDKAYITKVFYAVNRQNTLASYVQLLTFH